MAEERKAEDFPLLKPTLGDNPPEEGSRGHELAMASLEKAMVEYNENLEAWLAGGKVPGTPDPIEEDEDSE